MKLNVYTQYDIELDAEELSALSSARQVVSTVLSEMQHHQMENIVCAEGYDNEIVVAKEDIQFVKDGLDWLQNIVPTIK